MAESEYIPENQLTIFDMFDDPEEPEPVEKCNKFRVDRVHWHRRSHFAKVLPHNSVGQVIALIPEYVKGPMEHQRREAYPTADYSEMLDIWNAYVWAVACTIPYSERAENDANGWLQAKERLKHARDNREPIKLEIWDYVTASLRDLEVIEYLPIPEGEQHDPEATEQS